MLRNRLLRRALPLTHGIGFSAVLTASCDKAPATGKARNKQHVLEKTHREAGRLAKADRIRLHNRGCIKLEARKERTQKRLRTTAFQAAPSFVDKAAVSRVGRFHLPHDEKERLGEETEQTL